MGGNVKVPADLPGSDLALGVQPTAPRPAGPMPEAKAWKHRPNTAGIQGLTGHTFCDVRRLEGRRQRARGRKGIGPQLDAGISARSARLLIDEAWRDEAPLYGLQITVAETMRWLRPAFTMDGIMAALTREPLRPGCDRIFALVGATSATSYGACSCSPRSWGR